jgi:hypothetical protein
METPKAAPPLRPVSDRLFAAVLSPGNRTEPLSPEEERNRANAAEALANVFSLRDSAAFDWYLEQGLKMKIAEADKEMKTGDGNFEVARAKWKALAELHDWLIGVEIHGRRTMDKGDTEIPRLTASLLLT